MYLFVVTSVGKLGVSVFLFPCQRTRAARVFDFLFFCSSDGKTESIRPQLHRRTMVAATTLEMFDEAHGIMCRNSEYWMQLSS